MLEQRSTLKIRVDYTTRGNTPLSLDRRCNLACVWCHEDNFHHKTTMPAFGPFIMEYLIEAIAHASERDRTSVKISGQGEPCLAGREDLCELVHGLKRDPKIAEVDMVTNGTLLAGMAEDLARAGLDGVTVSLNSLNPDTYAQITGRNKLDAALDGLMAAREAGLPVTVNAVYSAFNEGEIGRYVRLARQEGITVKFFDLLTTPQTKELFRPLEKLQDELETKGKDYGLDGSVERYVNPPTLLKYGVVPALPYQRPQIHLKYTGENMCPVRNCSARSRCHEGCRYSIRLDQAGVIYPCGARRNNKHTFYNLHRVTYDEDIRRILRSGGKS